MSKMKRENKVASLMAKVQKSDKAQKAEVANIDGPLSAQDICIKLEQEEALYYVARCDVQFQFSSVTVLIEKGDMITPDRPDLREYLLDPRHGHCGDFSLARPEQLYAWHMKQIDSDGKLQQLKSMDGEHSEWYQKALAEAKAARGIS